MDTSQFKPTTSRKKEFTAAILFPNIQEVITQITLEQEEWTDFLQVAEELRDKAVSMHNRARELSGLRMAELSDLLDTFVQVQKRYNIPSRQAVLPDVEEEIPRAQTPIPTAPDNEPDKQQPRGRPKITSVKNITGKQADTLKQKLKGGPITRGKPKVTPAISRKSLPARVIYSDSDDDDRLIIDEDIKKSSSKKEQLPVSKYVSQGIAKMTTKLPKASTSNHDNGSPEPESIEDQILAWNKKLADLYRTPDPRLPLQIFLPQAGAHRAKSDPLFGTPAPAELKSWVEWNSGTPVLNVERYRDEGGRYTDPEDPTRLVSVDKRLIQPSTWRKYHKRLERAVMALEAKLRMNLSTVQLENIDDSIQELYSDLPSVRTTKSNKSTTRKRKIDSSDDEDAQYLQEEMASIDQAPVKATARKSFPTPARKVSKDSSSTIGQQEQGNTVAVKQPEVDSGATIATKVPMETVQPKHITTQVPALEMETIQSPMKTTIAADWHPEAEAATSTPVATDDSISPSGKP